MNTEDTLFQHAKAMLKRAYAPYSHFPVGAALVTEDGSVFSGCNIENAAYGLTTCAEACAISHMVAAGHTHIAAMAVIATSDTLCFPCGACRQRIREFSDHNTQLFLCDDTGVQSIVSLDALLPHSFSKAQLEP